MRLTPLRIIALLTFLLCLSLYAQFSIFEVYDKVYQLDVLREELSIQIPQQEISAIKQERVSSDRDKEKDICYPYPSILSSVSIWQDHFEEILNATFNTGAFPYLKESNSVKTWVAILLDHLSHSSPSQNDFGYPPLLKTTKTLPKREQLRPIVKKLDALYKYHQENDGKNDLSKTPPEPIKILVHGGSVTTGVLCRMHPFKNVNLSVTRKNCAWPERLKRIINKMIGFEAVQIFNDSLGGTNTELAVLKYQYGLLPQEMKKPDIIINAYSSNDMHVISMRNAEAKNLTLIEAVSELVQDFIRSVEAPKCSINSENKKHEPLLIFLDDYVGNEQHEILETMASTSTINTLANYYNIMSISYSDAIRHIVYSETRETWFSPDWYKNFQKKDFERQVHHGLGGHVSICWIVLFNFLNALTSFCNEEARLIRSTNKQSDEKRQKILYKNIDGKNDAYIFSAGDLGEVGLESDLRNSKLEGWPSFGHESNGGHRGIIPPLNSELLIQDVSDLWEESSARNKVACGQNESNNNEDQCVFSWIANVDEVKTEEALNAKMSTVMTDNSGWGAVEENAKLGFVPLPENNEEYTVKSFTMSLKNLSKSVDIIHLLSMKSYGEKWEGSMVHVDVLLKKKNESEAVAIAELDVEGSHKSETSVTYRHEINLRDKNVIPGDDLVVKVKLVGGNTFKFTGIAFCGL